MRRATSAVCLVAARGGGRELLLDCLDVTVELHE